VNDRLALTSDLRWTKAHVVAAFIAWACIALASPERGTAGDSKRPAQAASSSAPHAKQVDYATAASKLGCLANCDRCNNPIRKGGHRLDEGMLAGYKVEDFRPEPRNLYWQMDQVAGPDGKLSPLAFDMNLEQDRKAVYGRNTWIMWCAGNEGFWNWLAQDGYGFLDFLHVIDSRKRDRRFREFGLINQPGMKGSRRPGPWGLYLDVVNQPLAPPAKDADYSSAQNDYSQDEYNSDQDPQGRVLKSDGVNPLVYGYPTGVVGMRLFPNPYFDEKAKRLWNAEAFYDDPDYARNPQVVRPFRVGVSCGFCHVAPHPLNPPADPENPGWENLSSLIGNQYFRTSAITGSRASRGNFIWHVLAVAQPGTIDASLISTDHINNPNTMNAVFQVPARLKRADANPAELQGAAALTVPPAIEGTSGMRRTPHILLDGSDSIGAWGALARVYLNIGTFYEEWNECHNPVVGFTQQKPFSIEVCRSNSFYWQVNEKYRVGNLLEFFVWQKPGDPGQSATAPMKLAHASGLDEQQRLALDPKTNPRIEVGRRVFAHHCMVCHSSKQPEDFDVSFAGQPAEGTWQSQQKHDSGRLLMPIQWSDWDEFKASDAYLHYAKRAEDLSAAEGFLDENFLSTDIRIPISLVGTSAGRPLGRNALAGWVWSEFSSDTYKQLPAVGDIDVYNPFTKANAKFHPPAGGPGYARPATLVSVWATAPLLHNNALGKYLPDHKASERVSTAGRLEMFQDAIEKLLWPSKRSRAASGEGGLRDPSEQVWHGQDPGWVFRTDQETFLMVPHGHLRQAAQRTAPRLVLWFIDHPWVIPLILAVVFGLAIWFRNRWIVFLACIVVGIVLLTGLIVTGAYYVLPWWVLGFAVVLLVIGAAALAGGSLPSGAQRNSQSATVAGIKERWYDWLLNHGPNAARGLAVIFLSIALFTFWQAGILLRDKIDGKRGDLIVGPIPKGVPVNALANIDPDASLHHKLAAGRGLLAAISKVSRLPRDKDYQREALRIFDEQAGPGLMSASSCPDLVLDRGHLFGESLSDEEKLSLIAYLKTL